MTTFQETNELYKRLRPKTLREVVGQAEVCKKIVAAGKANNIPHCCLFTGSSGTGKTTIIRILRRMMKCADADYQEINGSDARKIDDIRGIAAKMSFSPLGGPDSCRIYAIDECQALTPDAQNALLKYLEDPPPHVYFFLSSSEPEKLKRAIRTRATQYHCRDLSEKELAGLVTKTADDEGKPITDGVAQEIAKAALGSAREAMVILDGIINLPAAEQSAAIELKTPKAAAFALVKALVPFKGKPVWSDVARVLVDIESEDPEGLRRMVLAVCRKAVLKGDGRANAAAVIMEEFRHNWYDDPKGGLVISCWNVVNP